MKKSNDALHVWKPTGYQEASTFHTVWRALSSPVLLICLAAADVVVNIYFKLGGWMWAIAPSAISLAIVAAILRWRPRQRLLISNSQAKKYNQFHDVIQWMPNRYLNRINTESERTPEDCASSRLLYRHLVEALVILGLYEETEQTKTTIFTGDKLLQIMPAEFYTDFIFSAGIGYVLLIPSVSLIHKITVADERIISRVLREIGMINWTVERVSYDDDLVLFVLQDEQASRAYDFTPAE